MKTYNFFPFKRAVNRSIAQASYVEQRVSQSQITTMSILALAAFARFYQIGTESLWVDEHFSILDAVNLELGTRPLYYLLLHLWMGFSGTDVDAWLRLFSVPFSIATVWLIYQLAKRLVSESTGQIAAFMAAVSPVFVGYGQEIRMYALSTFLTLAGTVILASILQQPSRWKIAGWAILRWLAVMTTPLNIILLLPDAVICLWQFRQQFRWLWTLACGVFFIGAATVPSALVLKTKAPEFMTDWVSFQPKPGVRQVAGMLTEFTMFWPFRDLHAASELSLNIRTIGQSENMALFYLFATAVLGLFFAWGLYRVVVRIWKNPADLGTAWIAAWGLLPAFSILVVSHLSSTIWFARYLLFVAPYFLILLAAAFEYVWRNYRKVAIALAAVYLMGVSGGLSHYYTTLYHDDWKGIAQVIQAEEQPGDVIGLYPRHWDPEYTLPRYYGGGLPIQLMANKDDLSRPLTDSEQAFVASMLNQLPPTAERYWLVVYYPQPKVIDALTQEIEQRYTLLKSEQFPNSMNDDIYLYLVDAG